MRLTKERKEMMLKTIEVRLDGIKDASKRTSIAFLITIIASFALHIAMWNVYFSTARYIALYSEIELQEKQQKLSSPEKYSAPADSTLPLHEFNRRELIKEWIKNTYIPINILGVSINVNDFPILGSMGLLIISYWLFFANRRENRAIISLLKDVKEDLNFPAENQKKYDDSWNIANFVFQGIKDRWISFTIISYDKPLPDTFIFGVKHNRMERVFNKFSELLTRLVRTVALTLVFIPAITIGMILWTDDYSTYHISSPFRVENIPPAEYMVKHGYDLPPQLTIENSIGAMMGGLTLLICFACFNFQFRTARELRAFEKALDIKESTDSSVKETTKAPENSAASKTRKAKDEA